MKKKSFSRGFTLIELLLVMGLIAMLAAVALVAINPARQFAHARDTQRTAHLHTILTAVQARTADNKGVFETNCGSIGAMPGKFTLIESGSAGYNLLPCLVPDYISQLPIDPKRGVYVASDSYNTEYEIMQDPTSGRIIIRAPYAELQEEIVISN
jgi:prepilin-type N-terminal cleavage/methylation domain-containing protein